MNAEAVRHAPDVRQAGRLPHAVRQARRLSCVVGAAAALALFVHLSAQTTPLKVEREGDRLRLSAPGLHFLAGEPLERLHDGRSVVYGLSATIEVERGDPRSSRITRHVLFSYDLWEERFSATQIEEPKTSVSHLSPAAAEAWCLELLKLPLRLVPADKTFVVKFECWLRDDPERPADSPGATTLTGLIDLLSRNAREAPPRWEAVSPRLRLADLKDRAK
jgi:hypothetical protein